MSMALPVPPRAFDPSPLYELTQAVAAARSPEEIYEAALDCIHASLGVERASVLLFDGAGVMRFRAWRDLSDEYRAAVDGHSPWSPDTTDAEPVLVQDTQRDESLGSLRSVIEGEGIRALAFIPLGIGGRLLGKFMFYYGEPHTFGEQEVLVARTIATHVAFAIEQQAHRESEAKARAVLETAVDGIITIDEDGVIESFNPAAERIFGYRADAVVGRNINILMPPPDSEQHDDYVRHYLQTGERKIIGIGREVRGKRSDGTMFAMDLAISEVRVGPKRRFTGIVHDISDRKRAEDNLRRSEAKARAVLETAVDGIITIDEAGVIESFNPAAERIFGYEASEIVGHKINDLMPPPDSERHDEYIRNYVETGERKIIGIGREVIGRRKDGSTFPMDLAISEVRLGDQRIFTGLVRDITERKQAESRLERMYEESRNSARELESALAAKDEFLGLMSHELRTPITTILGNAEILARRGELLDADARRTASADMAEEAARLNILIGDLLTLARLERGKLEPEPLALGRLISQIVEEHGRKSAAPVDCRDLSDSAIVLGDENLIGQVMRNYLTNAEKYSPPGSRTEVVVERGDGEARVRVLDRGIGIDAAESERLFEPFYRSAQVASIGGLGIGLAVCRRLIEAVGGELWAAPREGGGSEFGFSLALCTDDDPSG
jgi:PAS domain S-box-containing protein